MTIGRWISLIVLMIFFVVSGPIGCKTTDNTDHGSKTTHSEQEDDMFEGS